MSSSLPRQLLVMPQLSDFGNINRSWGETLAVSLGELILAP
jgi:hypothetical protein